ncbi:MAG: ATP synthase F1 subunit delta [Lachnospiraceae bacterium]|uniref:ATP synthase subunit delta n=1 Tax=Candidatus Weimeria bifida TaxID=2599074 RepID=A0A6N7J1I8_9FIRM|nr:ATP synthase F1 subunit delta [Candidatus Weimeria bifida]RRF96208.1 MAG: ATP synthase F1 subunit delta [Lachnospiraceae bacterium]
MSQATVHNNALVLSELPVDKNEVLSVLRELDSTPAYMELLMSPVIYSRKKEAVERKLAEANHFSRIFTDFLLVMIRNHNEKYIPDILREYVKIEEEKDGLYVADLQCARQDEIEKDQECARTALEKIFPGKTFRFCVEVKPSLIGGYIVRCKNNIEIDRSYEGQLRQLAKKINGR